MKTRNIIVAAVAVLVGMSVASSRGQTLDLSGGTLEGVLTNQELTTSLGGSVGNISSWVVSDSSIDSTGYIFIYQLENTSGDTIAGVSLNNFLAVTNAPFGGSYSSETGLTLATSVTPASTGAFSPDTVTSGGAATFFGNLPTESAPGTPSWFIVVYTDVDSIKTGYALTQDDVQGSGDILAPIAAIYPVPEPSSLILLTGGILCFYGILRVRRAMS